MIMSKQDAIEELRYCLRDYVERTTKGSPRYPYYICPLCGSGEKENKTGAFTINKKDRDLSWKCFSCGSGGDIFDLYGHLNHTADFIEKLKGLCNEFNITIENENQNQDKNEQYTHTYTHTHSEPQEPKKEEPKTDYTAFLLEAHKHIKETDYPQKRGLSEEIINRFKLGYVPEWRHPEAPNTPPSPRLIIPISKYKYFARDIRDNLPPDKDKYSKQKVGGVSLFNSKALTQDKKPIFIVEGEIDALSILEVGGAAVALGSTTNTRGLIERCSKERPAQLLILALDNDKPGQDATEKLIEGFKGLNIPYKVYNPYGAHKDANEALQADREALKREVGKMETVKENAGKTEQPERQNEERGYKARSAAFFLEAFKNGIKESANTPCIPTGFKQFDKILEGGLYEGLYNIGAATTLGKTTFICQIADHIAESGQDVLIFSLEMARNELISRSVSRHTLKIAFIRKDYRKAKTARGITAGARYKDYTDEEKRIIADAIEAYSEYAGHIYIVEGIGDIGVNEIKGTVSEHIKQTGKKPVVIVDYLQILAPYNERASDKQNIDKAVIELKRLSRDYKLPLLCISSFNRAAYEKDASTDAFKESGSIEYSSDVLIALQLKGVGTNDYNSLRGLRKDIRQIELVVLKNRGGQVGDRINFSYIPKYNFFEETETGTITEALSGLDL